MMSKAVLVIQDKLRLIRLHTWLVASLALVTHTALIDNNFGKVPVYLMPTMVSVAMQASPHLLSHRSPLNFFSRRTASFTPTRWCAVKVARSAPRRG